MGIQIQSPNPRFLCRKPQNKCTISTSRIQSRTTISCSSKIQNQEQPSIPIPIPTLTQNQVPKPEVYSVEFKTMGGCKLGIGRYPDFEYNAEGGKGIGIGKTSTVADFNGDTSVDFDAKSLYIPPLSTATTKFLGLPLPPFLKIDIVPEIFRGTINQESGKVDLSFKAKFWFSVGSIYRAPPLLVETLLTSEESKGTLRSGNGERLNGGRCRLVGVATVDPIDDFFMNSFLALPTECLASLDATISFSSNS